MTDERILFEIDVSNGEIKALGIPLDAGLDSVKIMVNGVDLLQSMKITELKIVKSLK